MAKFNSETTLLIQGIKGKFDEQSNVKDIETIEKLNYFIEGLKSIII